MPDAGSARPEGALRVAVVGVSGSRTCGVRDHAVLLADALAQANVSCSMHWLWRSADSIRGARSQIRDWTSGLAGELDRSQPDAVLLHYSVFSCSYRGFPLFVPAILSALPRSRAPLITVLHEFAYPWTLGGLHGKAWALSQRAMLIGVMRDSAAVVVTAPSRIQWLATRPWLPRRRADLAPVFSNLPPPEAGQNRRHGPNPVIGLFGYAYEGTAVTIVLDAVRLLRDRGLQVELKLLGAPGRDSRAAENWLNKARVRGVERALSFSGVLPGAELSNALAACDVLLHPEPAGPTSRKGTLAASLASGSAVVALDGPRGWPELVHSDAVLVVRPTAVALGDALAGLLEDDAQREALGARGAAFAEQRMGVQRSATVVAQLLGEVIARPAPSPASSPSARVTAS
jgi:glycosyltransferase involved in cell wall biosynthesis